MKKKKSNKGYQIAVFGVKGIIRLLIYVFAVLALIFAGKTSYSFGYAIFNEKPMDKQGNGKDITVVIPSDANISKIGKILEENNVIEDSKIFMVQANLSKYKKELKPGTYIINTSKTADEILAILAQVDVEGQPSETDKQAAKEDSSVFDKVDGGNNDEEQGTTDGDNTEDQNKDNEKKDTSEPQIGN